ncbi:MAG TPA: hypothetical protein PLS55_14760, partial [Thermogutta sp.]|nr:hypothetical protein [Thermogutta sp.]
MGKTGRFSRRDFLAAGTGVAVATYVSARALGLEPGQPSANNKLNVAAVGVGGMGKHDIAQAARTENVVAICDVDRRFA